MFVDTLFRYSLNHAAEVMNPYVQNYSCVPFTPSYQPCELGNYASYSINVTGANEVIAGIKFARENKIRLVIKNTGHEYDHFYISTSLARVEWNGLKLIMLQFRGQVFRHGRFIPLDALSKHD